jgi:hypothetical protein
MCQIAKLKIRKRCKTPEEAISVIIMWNGEPVELCKKCWERIPPDLTWGDDKIPTMEEIFGRRIKEEQEATVTEYRLKDKKGVIQNESEEEDVE